MGPLELEAKVESDLAVTELVLEPMVLVQGLMVQDHSAMELVQLAMESGLVGMEVDQEVMEPEVVLVLVLGLSLEDLEPEQVQVAPLVVLGHIVEELVQVVCYFLVIYK